MAFEQGLFNSTTQVSKDKFILQRNQLFNLTRTLTKFSFLDIPALHTNALSELCCLLNFLMSTVVSNTQRIERKF